MIGFLQNIGTMEVLVIFFVILLLFGAKRLPELFKAFGKSLGEFKKASREIEDDFRTAMDEGETPEAKGSKRGPATEDADLPPSPGATRDSEEESGEPKSGVEKVSDRGH